MRAGRWIRIGVLAAAGCGGTAVSSGAPDGGGATTVPAVPVSEAEFFPQARAAMCDLLPTCCRKLYAMTMPADPACFDVPDAAAGDPGAMPNVVFDQDRAGLVLAELRAAASTCLWSYAEKSALQEDLGRVYRGTLALGSACMDSLQCEAPSGRRAQCVAGICGVVPQKGEPCSPSTSGPCDGFELDCGATGMCEPYQPIGTPCKYGWACAMGLTCSSGVCAEGLPIGAPCMTERECASLACSGGFCAQRAAIYEPSDCVEVSVPPPMPVRPDAGPG